VSTRERHLFGYTLRCPVCLARKTFIDLLRIGTVVGHSGPQLVLRCSGIGLDQFIPVLSGLLPGRDYLPDLQPEKATAGRRSLRLWTNTIPGTREERRASSISEIAPLDQSRSPRNWISRLISRSSSLVCEGCVESMTSPQGSGLSAPVKWIPRSQETSRRLSCDASVVRVTKAPDGSILDVGRRTRTIPPALRRALEARDRGCRFPGSGSRTPTPITWFAGSQEATPPWATASSCANATTGSSTRAGRRWMVGRGRPVSPSPGRSALRGSGRLRNWGRVVEALVEENGSEGLTRTVGPWEPAGSGRRHPRRLLLGYGGAELACAERLQGGLAAPPRPALGSGLRGSWPHRPRPIRGGG
jgi:hypothetical protein